MHFTQCAKLHVSPSMPTPQLLCLTTTMCCCCLPAIQQACKLPPACYGLAHPMSSLGLLHSAPWGYMVAFSTHPRPSHMHMHYAHPIILHTAPKQLCFLVLTQFFLSLLCLVCLRRLSLCRHHNFLRLLSPRRSSLFSFIKKHLLFVSKWLKYSIPPTFFWIFYYLVAMVPKACGGWLAFCPLVLTVQTHISLHCPCSPKYMTWGSYEMLPSWSRAPPCPDQGTGQWLLQSTKTGEETWKVGS